MKTKNKEKRIYIYKMFVTIIFALLVMFVLNISQNYIKNEIENKINLVINNSNVTKSLKNDVIIENDVIYISTKDIANFFDDNIFYDNKYDQIITSSDTKLATLKIGEKKCTVNSSNVNIIAPAKKIEDQFYFSIFCCDFCPFRVFRAFLTCNNCYSISFANLVHCF